MCQCTHEIASQSSFLEILLPTIVGGMISAVLAVALFFAGKKKDHRMKLKEALNNEEFKRAENKGNWYVNVLINPNLRKVDAFFNEIDSLNVQTVQLLMTKKDSVRIKTYQNHKAKSITQLKKKIRRFELDFCHLVTSNHKSLENSLFQWRLDIEDSILNVYDGILNTESNEESLLDELSYILSRKKGDLFRVLFQPLTKSKDKKIPEN